MIHMNPVTDLAHICAAMRMQARTAQYLGFVKIENPINIILPEVEFPAKAT